MPSKKRKYNARFPAGRIKKIMQTDEEIGKVAQAVPVIISRTLELFVESLLKKSVDITNARNAKTLTPSHMKQCIMSESKFDFLADLVKNIPDAVNEDESGDVSNSNFVNRRRSSAEIVFSNNNMQSNYNKSYSNSKPSSTITSLNNTTISNLSSDSTPTISFNISKQQASDIISPENTSWSSTQPTQIHISCPSEPNFNIISSTETNLNNNKTVTDLNNIRLQLQPPLISHQQSQLPPVPNLNYYTERKRKNSSLVNITHKPLYTGGVIKHNAQSNNDKKRKKSLDDATINRSPKIIINENTYQQVNHIEAPVIITPPGPNLSHQPQQEIPHFHISINNEIPQFHISTNNEIIQKTQVNNSINEIPHFHISSNNEIIQKTQINNSINEIPQFHISTNNEIIQKTQFSSTNETSQFNSQNMSQSQLHSSNNSQNMCNNEVPNFIIIPQKASSGFHFNILPSTESNNNNDVSSSSVNSSSSTTTTTNTVLNAMVPSYIPPNNFTSSNLVIDEDYDC